MFLKFVDVEIKKKIFFKIIIYIFNRNNIK